VPYGRAEQDPRVDSGAVDIRRPRTAEPASELAGPGNGDPGANGPADGPADPDLQPEHPLETRAAHDADLTDEPGPEDLDTGAIEERVPRVIPKVEPRTTADLPTEAPPRQRYPVKLRPALGDLWRARELLEGLVERDLRVRYKQAILGVFWAVLNPLLTMVLFTLVFGHIAKVAPKLNVPYPVFAYSALVPWSLFQSATNYSVNAIIANAPIVRKIYCPREVFPIAAVASSFADFLISFLILFGMIFAFEQTRDPHLAWLAVIPLLFVMTMLMLALAMLSSGAIAYFRDIRYIVPSVLQALLFLTPIAYPLSKITHLALFRDHPLFVKAYVYLNPLVPIMDGFRRALVFGQWPMWGPLGSATLISGVLLWVSYWWYKRIDGYLADVI
jgi:ABC-type polysaccharide/polyol phosphate export permease